MSLKKTFLLDTNVLLHDPEALEKFPRSNVVIPVTVLEELDRLKRLPNELGKNARAVFRYLASLPSLGSGDLHNGVSLKNEAVIKILMEMPSQKDAPSMFSLSNNDNRIIFCAWSLKKSGENVVFVSKDFAARIKAEALGIDAEDYENLKYSFSAMYKGHRTLELTKNEIDRFFKDGKLEIVSAETETEADLVANEYCLMKSPEGSSAMGKYNAETKTIEPLLSPVNLWGVKPRNVIQRCAVDALLRDDIQLVTLLGQAGTGKTLLALACALRKVFDEGSYTKVLVSRPIVPLGRDIGYLPGTKEEKLLTWMQPIFDNLEYLCESSGNGPNETLRWVTESKKLEMEAVTYIRGRTLPKMYLIIDEAQNLTPHEIKTVISRAGEGTKVILTGDPSQIDNPYLDQDSNGLTYTVGRFRGQKLFSQLFLDKTERSQLAAIAAQLL